MRKLAGIILFFGIIALILFHFATPPSIDFNELEVTDISGNKVNLNDYRGKPLIVNFWATWCGPCMQEIPDFDIVQSKYEGSVKLLMVYDQSSLSNIQGFFKKYHYNLTFVQSQKGFKKMGIYSIPTTYFLDKDLKVIDSKSGLLDVNSLESMIQKIQ